MKLKPCVCVSSVFVCSGVAFAGVPQNPVPPNGVWANAHLGQWRPDQPDFGLEFATVGRPGNRGALASERVVPGASMTRWPELGRVEYEYRISTTEVSASQWLPFLQAFTPRFVAAGGSFTEPNLASECVRVDPVTGAATILAGHERSAVRVGWAFAARYCNWLHNGAPTGPDVPVEVFLSGAYDMPALTGPASFDYPLEASEGARYRLPTVHEWIKAAHYDPDRYGEAEEGYWLRHAGQDDPLTPGLPWQGGQTSAGPNSAFGVVRDAIPVGAYEGLMSPWGLYDTSGGETEWTGDPGILPGNVLDAQRRYILGTASTGAFTNPSIYDATDAILAETLFGPSVDGWIAGFRIVSVIPPPGAGCVIMLGGCLVLSRRRG